MQLLPMSVPTLDADVRLGLRALKEPIQLFGEGPADRRARLGALMDEGAYESLQAILHAHNPSQPSSATQSKTVTSTTRNKRLADVLSNGPAHLAAFRTRYAAQTLLAAKHRISLLKRDFTASTCAASTLATKCSRLVNCLTVRNVVESEASVLPLTCVVAPNSASNISSAGVLVTGSADGVVRLWRGDRTAAACYLHKIVPGAWGNIQCVVHHPYQELVFATSRNSKEQVVSAVSYSSDTDSMSHEGPVTSQHIARITSIAVAPSGTLMASCSEDTTLNFWDLTTAMQSLKLSPPGGFLYAQDGHDDSAGATRLAFHPDGSLLTSCDSNGSVLTWDCRTGRMVFSLATVHSFGCYAVAWSGCGVLYCTGGGDSKIHIWDARKCFSAGAAFVKKPHDPSATGVTRYTSVATLTQHRDVITSLSFANIEGLQKTDTAFVAVRNTLISTSLDGSTKLWGLRHMELLQSLSSIGSGGIRGHCMSRRQSGETHLITVGKDKHWRAWAVDSTSSITTRRVEHDAEALAAHDDESSKKKHRVEIVDDDDDDDEDEMEKFRKAKK